MIPTDKTLTPTQLDNYLSGVENLVLKVDKVPYESRYYLCRKNIRDNI